MKGYPVFDVRTIAHKTLRTVLLGCVPKLCHTLDTDTSRSLISIASVRNVIETVSLILSNKDQEIDELAHELLEYFSDAEAKLVENADDYDEADGSFVTWITSLLRRVAILDNNDSKSISMPPSHGIDQN